jgi:uncharacterized protein (TIGR02246 family)
MDEGGVRDLYARLLDAWNSRDAEAFASLFAPDGTSVGFDGSVAVGEGIADHLRPIFADHPTAAYVAKVRGVRPIGAEVAVLRAIVGMVPPGRHELNPDTNAQQTLVVERHPDVGWRIVLFQNTPAQYHGRPELSAAHTAELEPLVADRGRHQPT